MQKNGIVAIQKKRVAAIEVDAKSAARKRATDIPSIGAPATRAIAKLGITKLRGFTRYSKHELLAKHGIGPKAISIVQKALRVRGLAFKNGRAKD